MFPQAGRLGTVVKNVKQCYLFLFMVNFGNQILVVYHVCFIAALFLASNLTECASFFFSQVIDPDNPTGNADCVRILLLQFSCLLVEQALPHTHDSPNKAKLRRLMTFAWPCFLENNCVDPATRYHGHLLLSHIIAKFAIPSLPYKRIVLKGKPLV